MAALATRPLTLVCDLDLLLSSGSSNDETSGATVPEPSFTYTVGERPSAAHASSPARPGGNFSDSLAQKESDSLQTRHAWLRPGVRRFLLAVNPHFKTVLLVRRRCSAKQPCCCNGSARSFSADGSHRICDLSDGGSGDSGAGIGTHDLAQVIGGCSASLLAAALPTIDPDGQFFGQRVLLVQEQLRPRTAQPRLARGSCPSGEAAALAAAAAAAGANTAGESLLFPARARDLGAVAAALGERPSTVLVVTTADRSLFGGGSLAEQVVECQPYRNEYGKYDDVLDCLATVVTGLLAEASVPLGLRRLGLLHSRVQASPMMQTLHAQVALRRHHQAAAAAAPPPQQQRQQQQQYAGAAVRKSGSRRSSGGRRHTEGGGGGGGDGGRPTGPSSTGPISGSSTSPLAPIPELPLLEVGAEWSEGEDETNSAELSPPPVAALTAASPLPQGPSPGRSSAATASSSLACDSAGHPRAPSSQCRSLSSPPALCATSEPIGVNRSSAGSGCTSNRSSSSGGGGGGGVALAVSPVSLPLPGCRRMAWDAAPSSEGASGRSGGGLVAVVDSSAATEMLQSLKPPPTPGSAGGGGFGRWRGSSSGGGGEPSLGWRPRSFPAATKPPVTRLISDCASQTTGGGGGVAAAVAPASPLSTAASALAAATSRLLARILGGRRQRRCRPSDVGEYGGGDDGDAVIPPSEAAAAVMPWRSAVSATGDLGFFVSAAALQHARPASSSAGAPPNLTGTDRYFAVRQANASGFRSSASGAVDPTCEVPSQSTASATAAAGSAASTPAAFTATRPPSAASPPSPPQPWAAADKCASRRSPPPPRTPHAADGREPAAPAPAMVTEASMHRLSGMGKSLTGAASSDQTDLLLQQQQQQPPPVARAAARAKSGDQNAVGAAVCQLLSTHAAGLADQRERPCSGDGGLSAGREAAGRGVGDGRCGIPVMVLVGAAPAAAATMAVSRVSLSDAPAGAMGGAVRVAASAR